MFSHNQPLRSARAKAVRLPQAANAPVAASMQSNAANAKPEPLAQDASVGLTIQADCQTLADQTQDAEPRQHIQLTRLQLQQHEHTGADQHLQFWRSQQDKHVAQRHQQSELGGDVSLSCSMEQNMRPELDADVSSRLQPFPSQHCGVNDAF